MGSVIENTRTKEKCQIFTPDDIVKDMLDYLGYSDNLYGKTILESSCGNGQFLKEIVKRYIEDSQKKRFIKNKNQEWSWPGYLWNRIRFSTVSGMYRCIEFYYRQLQSQKS